MYIDWAFPKHHIIPLKNWLILFSKKWLNITKHVFFIVEHIFRMYTVTSTYIIRL